MIPNKTGARFTIVVAALAMLLPTAAFAQARSYLVNIDSQPEGATVRLDSATATPIGTTPLQRTRLPRGPHTLYFSLNGYIDSHIDVTVSRPRDTFTATLMQAGSIYVAADVDGAQVFMDGTPVGTTPGRINGVQPGQHVVEIRQAGMNPFQQTVTVGAGAVATVNATIRPPPPSPPPSGAVHVIVTNPNGPLPADLQVSFDGTPMTGTPPSVDAAPPGTHIVQVSANGFRTIRREVSITAGQTFALAVDLDPVVTAPTGGSVRVIVPTQGAQVYLDGEVITNPQGGPASRDNVPAGTHSIRVTAQGRQTVTREITVTAGQATNIELPDLEQVAQVGLMRVVSPTPNAHVFIDGRDVGPSPFERPDFEAGSHTVTVRAQGFDDHSETCSVSPTQACDLSIPLTRTVGHASLHIELSRPIPGAVVLIDGNAIGEVGAGRDIPNITAENHEIRVRATGFEDYVESVTLQENEAHRTMVSMRRAHTGPTGAQLASRRAAISTWGASPLARGDVAVDVLLSYGSYPLEVRGTTGLIDYGAAGVDAGFSIRTMGYITELELRGRLGYRGLDGLVAAALELRGFAGLGIQGQGNYGGAAYAVVSLHSLTPTSDTDADTDDPNEHANQFGSFALSLRLGVEATSDGLNGMQLSSPDTTTSPPSTHYNFNACNSTSGSMSGHVDPCGIYQTGNTRTDAMTGNVYVNHGAQGLVRAVAGVMIEFGLSRHANLFAGVDRVLGDNSNFQQQRAYYQSLWGGNDTFTYVHLGLTYKF